MSFCLDCRGLRKSNSYNLKARPIVSAHGKQLHEESETHTADQTEEFGRKINPNLTEGLIKANLETVHAQISTLTQMLAQDNSAGKNPTAGPRDGQIADGTVRTSRALPITSIENAGYSPTVDFLGSWMSMEVLQVLIWYQTLFERL